MSSPRRKLLVLLVASIALTVFDRVCLPRVAGHVLQVNPPFAGNVWAKNGTSYTVGWGESEEGEDQVTLILRPGTAPTNLLAIPLTPQSGDVLLVSKFNITLIQGDSYTVPPEQIINVPQGLYHVVAVWYNSFLESTGHIRASRDFLVINQATIKSMEAKELTITAPVPGNYTFGAPLVVKWTTVPTVQAAVGNVNIRIRDLEINGVPNTGYYVLSDAESRQLAKYRAYGDESVLEISQNHFVTIYDPFNDTLTAVGAPFEMEPSYIAVTSPVGAFAFYPGGDMSIQWAVPRQDLAGPASITLYGYDADGGDWAVTQIATGVTGNSYDWTVPKQDDAAVLVFYINVTVPLTANLTLYGFPRSTVSGVSKQFSISSGSVGVGATGSSASSATTALIVGGIGLGLASLACAILLALVLFTPRASLFPPMADKPVPSTAV